jgi:hypothetical protein
MRVMLMTGPAAFVTLVNAHARKARNCVLIGQRILALDALDGDLSGARADAGGFHLAWLPPRAAISNSGPGITTGLTTFVNIS